MWLIYLTMHHGENVKKRYKLRIYEYAIEIFLKNYSIEVIKWDFDEHSSSNNKTNVVFYLYLHTQVISFHVDKVRLNWDRP